MQYDPNLVERLSALDAREYEYEVFRVTFPSADPTAPSVQGGRWAFPQGTSVLYTSLERDAALAEVTSFLSSLDPIPKKKLLRVSTLTVSVTKAVTLTRENLVSLGVDLQTYGTRDYSRTQEIGSALAWLGHDALIAPSARWEADNLIVFTDNHSLSSQLEITHSEEIDWKEWASMNGFIKLA